MKDILIGALVGVALAVAFALVFSHSIHPSRAWCHSHSDQEECQRK